MGPPRKKLKLSKEQPAEILFDTNARQDYLTGFHKRKVARAEHAKEQAVKKAKEERIEERRQIREQRKADLAKHYHDVNVEFRKMNPDISSDEEDVEGTAPTEPSGTVPEDEEYVDEDKYTTVTVEAMEESEEEIGHNPPAAKPGDVASAKKSRPNAKPKVKKKKFRYETKAERKDTRMKQKAKNKRAALARKEK